MLQTDASPSGATPEARNDVDSLNQCAPGSENGNVITGAGTMSGAAGADTVGHAPAQVVAVNGTEGSGGTIEVQGSYGTLVMQADGSYLYTRSAGAPEGVSDVFTYTIVDASGARSTATLTIDLRCQDGEEEAQNLVTTPDGAIILPAGVELSDIRVVGRDLVITLPDGSTMTIPNGAVFVPQLVIGDVEVPPSNLAALLIDSEPQPASGTPQSSGGNFEVDVPPLDPGVPLGDLIPPTDFGYTPPTFEPAGQDLDREPEIFIQPDGQPATVAAIDSVDERGLPTRNSGEPAGSGEIADGNGSNNSDPSEATTGTIVFSSPDGIGSITINGVVVSSVGQVIAGTYGSLTITSINLASGTIGYSYTLADNTSGDSTNDNFTVSITDTDGDIATATLRVDIIDDVPTARADTDAIAAGQFGPETGNVMTGVGTTSGAPGADTVGADNATLVSISGAGGTDTTFEAGVLVVNGQYGVLTIAANGEYSYVRNAGTPGGVNDVFNYTLRDGDGDTSTTTLTISIGDRTPSTSENPTVLLDDDALPGGNPGSADGSDDVDSANVSGTLSGSGGDGALTFDLLTTGAPAGFTYVDGPNGSILVQQGGVTVLTITIDASTGAYTVTQNAPIDHSVPGTEDNVGFTINYTVSDVDGDSAPGTLSINVDDDTPTIGRAFAGEPTVTVDETDLSTNASGDFSTLFQVAYGADGPGSTTYSLGVVAGSDSGLVDVATGDPILLFDNGGVIEGRVGGSTGAVAFTVSVNSTTGVVTLDQIRALDHPDATNPDDPVDLGGTSIQLTITAVDGDGDPATQSANIGANLVFRDDGPSISGVTAGVGVVLDETDAGSPAGFPISASSAGAVVTATTAFGADGAGTVTYGLSLPGGVNSLASGLATAIGDFPITLVQIDGDTIQGQYNGTNVAFTIDMNADGTITVTQEVPLEHLVDGPPGPAHDDALDLTGLVNATVTVTDGDGDAVSGSAAIGNNIVFEDDGPSIDVTAASDAEIILQTQDAQTIGGASDTASSSANFSGVFGTTVNGGADGAAGAPLFNNYALGVSAQGVDSGLDQGGANIYLYLINGAVVGSTSATIDGVDTGNIVFGVSVSGDGTVTLTQYSQIDHSLLTDPDTTDTVFDDHIASMADDLITLSATATVTDNDGDTASDTATIGIGANLQFADDGPDISAVLTGTQIRIDETDGVVAAGGEVDPVGGNLGTVTVQAATLFTVSNLHSSADSPTTLGYALTLSSQGAASGLLQSANNDPIYLYNIGGTVFGSTSATVGGVSTGNTVFTVSIDSTGGAITLTQFQAIEHFNTGSNDEDSSALLANVLNVTITATDFDGDTDTATVDLGSIIRFEDDGPSANPDTDTVGAPGSTATGNVITDAAAGDIGDSDNGADNVGSDTPGSITNVISNFAPGNPDTDPSANFQIQGHYGVLTMDTNGNYVYTRGAGTPGGVQDVFTYTLTDADGDSVTSTLTISLADAVPVLLTPGPVQLDDDNALSAVGNPGGVGDDDVSGTTGNLSASGGDGDLDYFFAGSQTAPSGFSYNLVNSTTLQIMQGTTLIATVTLNNDTGAYTVVQNNPVQHDSLNGQPGDNTENNTPNFNVAFVARDADGDDSNVVNLVINIDDDTPVATTNQLTGLVDEDGVPGGIGGGVNDVPGTETVASGNVSTLFSPGADTPLTYSLSNSFAGLTSQNLSSGGTPLSYGVTFNAITGVYTLTASAGANPVFTLTLNSSTGAYTFTLLDQLDHASLDNLPGDNTENNLLIALGSVIQATDSDGDLVTALTNGLVITVNDDTPTVNNATLLTGTVDEDGVPSGIAGGLGDVPGEITTASGSVATVFSSGADSPLTYNLSTSFAGLTSQNLSSGGVTLTYAVTFNAVTGVYTLTASAGLNAVFTLTLNASSGAYTFTLLDQLDHATLNNLPGDNTENDLLISLGSIIQATDADGDTVTANPNSLVITVDDDMPSVFDPAAITSGLQNQAGESETALLDVDGNINNNVGADQPGLVTFANITNGADSGLTAGGAEIDYFLTNNGQTLEARVGGAGGTLIFNVVLNQGAGNYTVNMFGSIDNGSGISFDNLTSTNAGNVLYRGVGANDPVTTVDLLLSASSGASNVTVNTDSDSIGAANQSMDVGETLRIDFVTNLTSGAATPTGFGYGGHVDTNSFLGLIPQVQGNQAQTVSFKVWALDTGLTQGTAPDSNPTGGFDSSSTVTITSVTVIGFDSGESTPVTANISSLAVGGTQAIAYGISVTRNGDGSITFSGVQEGDQYGFSTGSNDFNAVVVQDTVGSFDLGVFSIGVVDSGNPIHLNYDLALSDFDGDRIVVTDALDITIAPNSTTAAATTSAKSTALVSEPLAHDTLTLANDNLDHQLRSASAANNNTVFLGAIAAAGMSATVPVAAHSTLDHVSDLAGSSMPTLQSESFQTAMQATSTSNSLLESKSTALVQDGSVSHNNGNAHSDTSESQSVSHTDTAAQSAPAALPEGTEVPSPAPQADSSVTTAMSVAMPAAQDVASANAPGVEGHAAAGPHLGQVLADALSGGGNGPNIDALLDAAGAHAPAAALATQLSDNVPAWHSAGFSGFTAGHSAFTMDAMAIHPDAVPHTAA